MSKILKVCCIDNSGTGSVLTKGRVYEVYDSGDKLYRPTNGWNSGTWTSGMLKGRFEVVEETGQYIVWSPDSTAPPSKTFHSEKQAGFVARKLAQETEQKFYVCQLVSKYTPVVEVQVTKEVL
jgi:hypothetical protein